MNISVKSSHRIVVAELHCAGHKSLNIIKEMDYDASTVDGRLKYQSLYQHSSKF